MFPVIWFHCIRHSEVNNGPVHIAHERSGRGGGERGPKALSIVNTSDVLSVEVPLLHTPLVSTLWPNWSWVERTRWFEQQSTAWISWQSGGKAPKGCFQPADNCNSVPLYVTLPPCLHRLDLVCQTNNGIRPERNLHFPTEWQFNIWKQHNWLGSYFMLNRRVIRNWSSYHRIVVVRYLYLPSQWPNWWG
jgi:hypothetical protein